MMRRISDIAQICGYATVQVDNLRWCSKFLLHAMGSMSVGLVQLVRRCMVKARTLAWQPLFCMRQNGWCMKTHNCTEHKIIVSFSMFSIYHEFKTKCFEFILFLLIKNGSVLQITVLYVYRLSRQQYHCCCWKKSVFHVELHTLQT